MKNDEWLDSPPMVNNLLKLVGWYKVALDKEIKKEDFEFPLPYGY